MSLVHAASPAGARAVPWEHLAGLGGLVLLAAGTYAGLFVAPPEAMMGEVSRILYVHVPAAWLALVSFTICSGAALGYLLTGRRGFDYTVEAAAETGVVLNALLLMLGSIFARPTWGVFWTWDPRLTASAMMLLTFVGVLLLRASVEEPNRRALWSAVASVVAYVNIPVTYLSVRWWRSVHQVQSSPTTMSDEMVMVLRLNAVAFLLITVWFIARRWRIARRRALAQLPPDISEIKP